MAAGLTFGALRGEVRDDTESNEGIVEVQEVRGAELTELRLLRNEGLHREQAEEVVDVPPVTDAAQPEDTPAPAPEPAPVLTEVEAAICAYPWECATALRVFACESGPDYMAGFNASGHAGTAQISPIHAWRFAARGLNFWEHALVLEWNLDVAYEIWTERWWYAWSCF